MKKLLALLGTAAVLGSSVLLGAPKAEAHYDYYNDPYDDHAHVCTKSSALNVRYGPGTNYGVYTSFAKGTQVWYWDSAYDYYGNLWYQVTDGYSYGWVFGAYICQY